MSVKKAVIPAAGYGTRFLPITKGVPKEMLPIVDKPTIQYVVEEAISAGMTDIIIVLSEGKQAIRNYFGKNEIYDNLKNRTLLSGLDDILNKADIKFVLQKTMRGNGDAILSAKEEIGDEPFAVLFGDDVIYSEGKSAIGQLAEAFEKTGKCIVGVQRCEPELASTCGCIVPGKSEGKLTEMLDIIEKPPIDDLPSNLASLGRFVLPPDIIRELETAPLFKDEIYLTVAIKNLIKKTGGYAYEFDGIMYDLGSKIGFCKANVEFALRSEFGEEFAKYLKGIGEKP